MTEALKIDWVQMPTYNTIMSVAAGAALLTLVWFARSLLRNETLNMRSWALSFAVSGWILALTGGRLAVGGFRRPPTWSSWAVALGRAGTVIFGVTRAHEHIKPSRSVQRHMGPIAFETAAAGALYLIVAEPKHAPGEGDGPTPQTA